MSIFILYVLVVTAGTQDTAYTTWIANGEYAGEKVCVSAAKELRRNSDSFVCIDSGRKAR